MVDSDGNEATSRRIGKGGPEALSGAVSPPADAAAAPTDTAPAVQTASLEGTMSAGHGPSIAALSTALQRISTQLDALTGVVDARLSYDKAKEKAFERLYAELDSVKKNTALENIKPLLLDLILLYDRMEHAQRAAVDTEGTDGSTQVDMLKSFIDELLEVLSRREVRLMEVLASTFDCSQQRAIGAEEVTDPAQHEQIARVVRRGFHLGNSLLRPEDVIVRRLVKHPRTPAGGNGESKE